MKRISIALATYNGEAYIQKQMESLLNQTRPADEVIVIDDCSTDATVKLVTQFLEDHALRNWKLYQNKENQGYKRNFYHALEYTTGDFIFLCDQDDFWLPQKLEVMECICEKREDILSLSSSFRMVDPKGNPLDQKEATGWSNHGLVPMEVEKGELRQIPFSCILQYNLFPGCTTMIRRELKEKYLETSRQQMPHDWELNLLAGSEDGLYFYNEPLIDYCIHGNNTIGQSSNRHEMKFKMESTRQKRLRIVEEYLGHSEFLQQPGIRGKLPQKMDRILPSYEKYLLARKAFLEDGKLSSWIASLWHYPRAKRIRWIHLRHLLGDFIAVYRQ